MGTQLSHIEWPPDLADHEPAPSKAKMQVNIMRVLARRGAVHNGGLLRELGIRNGQGVYFPARKELLRDGLVEHLPDGRYRLAEGAT